MIHSCKPAPNQTKSSNADIVCIRYCKPNCTIFHCQIQRPQLFQTLVTRRLVGWQDQHHWQGVGDGGRRKGGSATSIRWATARPPRASLPAQRFPGCLSNILEVRVSQFVVLQVDILCRALHKEEEGHLMCAFPTGYGKSLPALLLGLLMPEGRTPNLIWEHQQVLSPITGSTVIIVVPLHTIEAQLVLECERLNIPAMAGSKVSMKSLSWGSFHMAKLLQISPREFDAAMTRRPKLLVCSVEFLADSQVGGVDYPICQLSFFPGAQRDSQESSCTSWNSPHCLYWWSTGSLHFNFPKILTPIYQNVLSFPSPICLLPHLFILGEYIRLSDLLENEQRNSTGEAANTITLLEQIQLLKMAYSRNENWAGIWKAASANTISLLKQIQLLKMAYSRNENWAGDMFDFLAEQWWHLRIFFLLSWDRETCMRSIYSNILPLQCNFFPGLAIVSKLSCFKGIGNPTDIHGSWGTWLGTPPFR